MLAFTSLATFALLATGAYAQTQAQIQACANTIKTVNYETYPTYSTADTSLYNITYSYDASLCTNPSTPVNRILLVDQDSGIQTRCDT